MVRSYFERAGWGKFGFVAPQPKKWPLVSQAGFLSHYPEK
jgi:hypothetical protein